MSRVFRSAAEAIASGRQELSDILPTLEFVATKYPPEWLLLADLVSEEAEGVPVMLKMEF